MHIPVYLFVIVNIYRTLPYTIALNNIHCTIYIIYIFIYIIISISKINPSSFKCTCTVLRTCTFRNKNDASTVLVQYKYSVGLFGKYE